MNRLIKSLYWKENSCVRIDLPTSTNRPKNKKPHPYRHMSEAVGRRPRQFTGQL